MASGICIIAMGVLSLVLLRKPLLYCLLFINKLQVHTIAGIAHTIAGMNIFI